MVRPSVRSTTRSSSVTRPARARAIASTVKVLMPGPHELGGGVELRFARLIHHPKIPFLPSRRVLEHLVYLARLQIVAAVVPNAKDKLRLWLPWLHWFRMPRPEAIVSIRVISPMISKYTCHCTRSRTYRSRLLGGMPSVNERADADVVYIGMPLQPCGNIAPVFLGR